MDHFERLRWVAHHIQVLKDSIAAFDETNPCTRSLEQDVKTRQYRQRLAGTPVEQTIEWSFIVGDILHNTRSSLDNLAYALAERHLNRALTPKEAKGVQFPITDGEPEFDEVRNRWLKHIAPAAQDVIKSVQPWDTPEHRVYRPLSVLRELSNLDKHRRIIVTTAAVKISGVIVGQFGLPVGGALEFFSRAKEGEIMAQWPDSGRAEDAYMGDSVQARRIVVLSDELADYGLGDEDVFEITSISTSRMGPPKIPTGPQTGGSLNIFGRIARLLWEDIFPKFEEHL